MILVLGATGTTGSAVVRELLAAGAPVRGLTRSEEGAEQLRALGAEAAVGDLADPPSLMGALRGVERMYLVSSVGEHGAELERNAVSTAEQAGVYHVVKLGMVGQSPAATWRFALRHADATEALQSSSLRWTILMCTSFMQNVLGAAPTIATGQYFSSLGDARVAHVDARDVGAVAALALSQEGHENCSYTLSGPEALANDELVATLTEVLGRPVEHVRVSDDEVAGALREAGLPDWHVEGLRELWRDVYRTGQAGVVTPDVEAVLGRPPASFRRFAEDHRAAFSG